MKKRLTFTDFCSGERVRFGFLFLFAATIFFTKLGLNGMANDDDCFYSQKAKEILQSSNWWVQSFNHQVNFYNAPLFQILQALSFKIFGVTVYAAKFPSAVMGFLTVLLVYFLGRFLFNPWAGFVSGFVLATTNIFFKYARHGMEDVTEAFFVALAMAFLILALRKSPRYFWAWGMAIGLAILTKSVMGLFPLIIAGLFLLLNRSWKTLSNPHFWGGLATATAMTGAWIASQLQANAEKFFQDHWEVLIKSKLTGPSTKPWYDHFGFLVDLLIYGWPWLPFLGVGLFLLFKEIRDPRRRETALYLLCWSLTVPLLMSFTQCRFFWYFMQTFPAFALVSAYGLNHLLSEKNKMKFSQATMAVGLSAVILLNALPFSLDKNREIDTRILAPYVKHYGAQGAKITALRERNFGLNNALMFFSDYAADPIFMDPQAVKEVGDLFKTKDLVLCIVHKKDLEEIKRDVPVWYQVKVAGDLVLISNQRLDTSEVKTWEGPWEN